tara:strand:- start:522 stop:701 length:180 start_codon:yes stop_codon:yes gene_type:complete
MKVKELIKRLQKCDQELDVNTFKEKSEDPTNYWVVDIEEYPKGSSGYENDGEVLLITQE